MANLTIAVDEEVLHRARIRAAGQGTSVNAILREELGRYAGGDAASRAVDEFLAFTKEHAGHGGGGRSWTREELYAERLGP